jgi:hypothetical protein
MCVYQRVIEQRGAREVVSDIDIVDQTVVDSSRSPKFPWECT